MKQVVAFAGLGAVLLVGAAVIVGMRSGGAGRAFEVPGLDPMTAAEVAAESYRVAPAMLSRV